MFDRISTRGGGVVPRQAHNLKTPVQIRAPQPFHMTNLLHRFVIWNTTVFIAPRIILVLLERHLPIFLKRLSVFLIYSSKVVSRPNSPLRLSTFISSSIGVGALLPPGVFFRIVPNRCFFPSLTRRLSKTTAPPSFLN